MGSHRFVITVALGSLGCSLIAVLGGCTDDGSSDPSGDVADGSASDAPSGSSNDAGGAKTDDGGPGNEGGTPTDGSTGSSTASLIPTDGGAYFVAAVNGTPLSLDYNLAASRGVTSFATVRGSIGITLPLRDIEIRFPTTLGPAACTPSALSVAGVILRTSDLGAFSTGTPGTSCSFEVTGLSSGPGERVKGTFSGTLKASTGETATITDGAFDVPTMN